MAEEYINRREAIETILNTPFTMSMCLSEEECHAMNRARRLVAELVGQEPIADVQPVKHAFWRYKTMTVPGGKGQTYAKWSCTNCKKKVSTRSTYCPSCGALMEEINVR